jgi:hypothetical protein
MTSNFGRSVPPEGREYIEGLAMLAAGLPCE